MAYKTLLSPYDKDNFADDSCQGGAFYDPRGRSGIGFKFALACLAVPFLVIVLSYFHNFFE